MVRWLTQQDTLTGRGRGWVQRKLCLVAVWRGVCRCPLKLQAQLPQLCFWILGLGLCRLRFSLPIWRPVRFLQSETQASTWEARRRDLFLFAYSFCATLVMALHPGISSGCQPPALGGTSRAGLRRLLLRGLSSTLETSGPEPLGLKDRGLFPRFPQPQRVPPVFCRLPLG